MAVSERNIVIVTSRGVQGRAGTNGADGHGLPPGGTINQIPKKLSSADYDIGWFNSGSDSGNIDGGYSNSIYGGTTGIDGGGA